MAVFYDDGTVKMTRIWTETVYEYDKLGNSSPKVETKSIEEAVGTYTGKTTDSEVVIAIVFNKLTKRLLFGAISDELVLRDSVATALISNYYSSNGYSGYSSVPCLTLRFNEIKINSSNSDVVFKKDDSN